MIPRKERAEKTGKELFLEQAAAENATCGQMFNQAEAFAVLQGRDLVRKSLETIVQEQVGNLEKKETSLCPTCQKKKGIADTEHRKYQ